MIDVTPVAPARYIVSVLTLLCTRQHRQQAVVWSSNIRVRHDVVLRPHANPHSKLSEFYLPPRDPSVHG
jgi:hypothetical protein